LLRDLATFVRHLADTDEHHLLAHVVVFPTIIGSPELAVILIGFFMSKLEL
jgi:hypothetical protein